MKDPMNIIGVRFGRLTAIRSAGKTKNRAYAYLFACDCGRTIKALGANARSGTTKSCGCLKTEMLRARTVHGATRNREITKEYRIWTAMKTRCLNPKNNHYHRYGGRGIRICERWLGKTGFANFLADMSGRPSPRHSIDRIDNDGNYEPGNCRWATRVEQARNTSRTILVTHAGETMPMTEWAKRLQMDTNLLRDRLIVQKMSLAEAVSTPVGRWKKQNRE